jgi:hypothetical protein
MYEQKYCGLLNTDTDEIKAEIPAHGTRVFRLAPYRQKPLVIGTDLHLSGGGELRDVVVTDEYLSGRVETDWDLPVTVTVGFPDGEKLSLSKQTTRLIKKEFKINKEDNA